jgi:hypothetical protein
MEYNDLLMDDRIFFTTSDKMDFLKIYRENSLFKNTYYGLDILNIKSDEDPKLNYEFKIEKNLKTVKLYLIDKLLPKIFIDNNVLSYMYNKEEYLYIDVENNKKIPSLTRISIKSYNNDKLETNHLINVIPQKNYNGYNYIKYLYLDTKNGLPSIKNMVLNYSDNDSDNKNGRNYNRVFEVMKKSKNELIIAYKKPISALQAFIIGASKFILL